MKFGLDKQNMFGVDVNSEPSGHVTRGPYVFCLQSSKIEMQTINSSISPAEKVSSTTAGELG